MPAGVAGYPESMEILIYAIVAILLVAIAFAVVSVLRAREQQRRLRREKLDGVAEGHREMADQHAGSLEELRPLALSHRQAAVDHTRKAEEIEQRIERQERHTRFHEERAAATEEEREQV